MSACDTQKATTEPMVFQTSKSGDALTPVLPDVNAKAVFDVSVHPDSTFQTITGIGGAFTESSAYLLSELSEKNRDSIIQAYFSDNGAKYSLCRTHINSCDFSLSSYAYDTVAGDTLLEHFSLEHEDRWMVPMIHAAQSASSEGFKLLASPWTAPPWMKDNQAWFGGKLLPRYYQVWANYFVKYAEEMQKRNIPIWAFTFENEPLGNNNNWESMHYTPQEMIDFVQNHLHPSLAEANQDIKLLMYDQNKGKELDEWAEVYLNNKEFEPYFYGTAVHWYNSTFDYFPESLDKTHALNPSKSIISTEACIDAEVPVWQDDAKYWEEFATDWGYDWAKEEEKHMHPKYAPVHRLAGDLIGSFNHHVEGWVDWNMVLDKKGGPNHVSNWCMAPVIVDPEKDEVYFTPLYYVMTHFSRYVRPGAKRIALSGIPDDVKHVAFRNPNNQITVILFNPTEKDIHYTIEGSNPLLLKGNAIQSIIL